MVGCAWLHRGMRAWHLQRHSTLFLILYGVAFFGFLWCCPADVTPWRTFLFHPVMKVLGSLFLVSLVAHAWVGLTTVITDYLKCAMMQRVSYVLVVLGSLAYMGYGLCLLWCP